MDSFDYSTEAQQQRVEQISQQLLAVTQKRDRHLFLLADTPALPEKSGDPFVTALVAQHPLAVKLPHERLPPETYPWLVALDPAEPAQAALLLDSIMQSLQERHPQSLIMGGGRLVCGWLTSAYDAETVARQLGETAIQCSPAGGKMLLRYYDPAVHSVLWHYFSALQRQRMLGVIDNWLYIDGDGQLVSHAHTPPPTPHYTFSLALSQDDISLLTITGKINRTLEQYRFQRQTLPRYGEVEATEIIRAALERAAAVHGFQQERDQQALALECLVWHPRFDMHPKIQVRLSPAERDARTGYSHCMQTLTDAARQTISEELAATATIKN